MKRWIFLSDMRPGAPPQISVHLQTETCSYVYSLSEELPWFCMNTDVICAKINIKSTQCVILYSPITIKRAAFRQTCVPDGATELPPETSTVWNTHSSMIPRVLVYDAQRAFIFTFSHSCPLITSGADVNIPKHRKPPLPASLPSWKRKTWNTA